MVDWSPFRHYHYFLLSHPMFENKNRICVWGCGASRQSESISISKNEASVPVLVQRVKLNPFRNYHRFNYDSQCLRSKIKFVWRCGASRECGRISISNSKGLLYYFKGLSGAHLDITIVLIITANVWEENKVCFGGVVLADSMKVFLFLKIKPLLYYFKWLTGVHLDITIVVTISGNVWDQKCS